MFMRAGRHARAMRALPVLCLLATMLCAGLASAGVLPDPDAVMEPVGQTGGVASAAALALADSTGGTLVDASGAAQAVLDSARGMGHALALQEQRDFAACPAGQGWSSLAPPDSVSLLHPDVPDEQPYALGLAASVQAQGPDLLTAQLGCTQAQLGAGLPAL
jgi:hypothetical protein